MQASRTCLKLTEGPPDRWDKVGTMWRDVLIWRGRRAEFRARHWWVLKYCTWCCCCSCTGRTLLVRRRRFCNFAGKGCLLLSAQNVSNIVRSCSVSHRCDWRIATLVSSKIILWPGSWVDAWAPLHPLRGCSWMYGRGVVFAGACRRVILHRDSHSRLIAGNLEGKNSKFCRLARSSAARPSASRAIKRTGALQRFYEYLSEFHPLSLTPLFRSARRKHVPPESQLTQNFTTSTCTTPKCMNITWGYTKYAVVLVLRLGSTGLAAAGNSDDTKPGR